MAKVPKRLHDKMARAKSDPRRLGTRRWINQHDRRDEIIATVEEYLKGRAKGEITMSLRAFTNMVDREFAFPFNWYSMRDYMQRYHQDLFDRQTREP